MNRRAEIRLHGEPVGLLEELADGFRFTYREDAQRRGARALSASLPLRIEPHHGSRLFPFFEGLLAEGELRKLQARQARVAEDDSFGLLLATCAEDAPGAVTVHALAETTR